CVHSWTIRACAKPAPRSMLTAIARTNSGIRSWSSPEKRAAPRRMRDSRGSANISRRGRSGHRHRAADEPGDRSGVEPGYVLRGRRGDELLDFVVEMIPEHPEELRRRDDAEPFVTMCGPAL